MMPQPAQDARSAAQTPELSVRTPRAIVQGLLLGFGAYVAIVAVFAVLGGPT